MLNDSLLWVTINMNLSFFIDIIVSKIIFSVSESKALVVSSKIIKRGFLYKALAKAILFI